MLALVLGATTPVAVVVVVATLLAACGGAAAIAQVARSSFARRRQEQRRRDATYGYTDEEGTFHPGMMDDFRAHIADKSIHLAPGGDHGTPRR